ncbi:MAG TPA: DNA/RNA nuclease SfsA [Gammaproteobacteria bacterium]|nr:DNA/RNA nuclease SfsA [Gammaproteobacteria bacterium]
MIFHPPLQAATLLCRYRRFLADVRLEDGSTLTVHTANTGAMTGCAEPGMGVLLSESDNPRRKYRHSWELSEIAPGTWVSVNTARANALVAEAVAAGVMTELQGYDTLRREVRFGMENSRVDLLLERGGRRCYVEVKNVTLAGRGIAAFPDAVSARGARHLRELMHTVTAGHRAVLCFCVARGDVHAVRPADDIDPRYGATLRAAARAGVEVIAYRAAVSPREVRLAEALPVWLEGGY